MGKIFQDYRETNASLQKRLDDMLGQPPDVVEELALCSRLPGMLDMTTLEGSDTREKVIGLCRQARFSLIDPSVSDAAAVCVYPSRVADAREALNHTGIKVASVAGGFPSGQTSLKVKLEEVKFALDMGADEIDTVISRGKLIEGRETEVFDELAAIRETCATAHLKVILETGELNTVQQVWQASVLAVIAGADFIKTSTGKISSGAEPLTYLVMLDTIKEYLERSGKTIGIKPAGGVRTVSQALVFARLFVKVMGEGLLTANYFRIGASSLAGEILRNLGIKVG